MIYSMLLFSVQFVAISRCIQAIRVHVVIFMHTLTLAVVCSLFLGMAMLWAILFVVTASCTVHISELSFNYLTNCIRHRHLRVSGHIFKHLSKIFAILFIFLPVCALHRAKLKQPNVHHRHRISVSCFSVCFMSNKIECDFYAVSTPLYILRCWEKSEKLNCKHNGWVHWTPIHFHIYFENFVFFSGLVSPFLSRFFWQKECNNNSRRKKTPKCAQVEAHFKIHVDDQRSIKFAANTNLDQFNMLFFILVDYF